MAEIIDSHMERADATLDDFKYNLPRRYFRRHALHRCLNAYSFRHAVY
ncbi:hypothetical protein [Methylomonas sp. MK1]|nr:hypothetical protein [Methylomonas sp. MK1]